MALLSLSLALALGVGMPGPPGTAQNVTTRSATAQSETAQSETAQSETALHFVAYSTGLRVLDLHVAFAIDGPVYEVRSALRTVGLFGSLVSGQSQSLVRGAWAALQADPAHYDSEGVFRGIPRRTAIEYADETPHVHDLLPDPDPDDREPVPPALQARTIDTLSALAALLHRVRDTGRCDATARLFDGRRLSEITVRTAAIETLAPTSRAVFHGPALRCDFSGRLLAGFKRGDDRADAARPRGGSAWFAALAPGQPVLPVRMVFETPFFGSATMYLAP